MGLRQICQGARQDFFIGGVSQKRDKLKGNPVRMMVQSLIANECRGLSSFKLSHQQVRGVVNHEWVFLFNNSITSNERSMLERQ